MQRRRFALVLFGFLFATMVAGSAHGHDADDDGFTPSALWDGRKIVPFRAIDHPPLVKASEAAPFLDDDEYVLGIQVGGESRAYPTRLAWWHHIINDTVGGKPIAITYCSVCNAGVALDRVVDGKPILLDFYGLYNGVACYCERATESVVLPVDGRIVTGALKGKSLALRPVLDTTWGQWKRLHPDTRVMTPENPFAKSYRPKGDAEPRGYPEFPAPFFRPTVTRGDLRLPPFEKVLAILSDNGTARAYPIAALQKAGCVVNEGDTVVFLDDATTTATAFSRRVDGQLLTFERRSGDGRSDFYDQETGSRWSIEGKAEAGRLAGKSLSSRGARLSQWYGWAAFFPATTIYGRTDPPRPGDPFRVEEPRPKN